METDSDIGLIQTTIGYAFKNPNALAEALTAAGADGQNYDGNRRLAQLGDSVVRTVILDNAYTIGLSRAMANERLCHADSRKNREAVAKRMGIQACVRLNPRQYGQPTLVSVMSRTISAIVGASWCDSGRDYGVVSRVIERIGITTREESCIAPRMALLDNDGPQAANTFGLIAENHSPMVPFSEFTYLPETSARAEECSTNNDSTLRARTGSFEAGHVFQEKLASTNTSSTDRRLSKRRKICDKKILPNAPLCDTVITPCSEAVSLERLFSEERRKYQSVPAPYLITPFENLLTHTCISSMGTDRTRMIFQTLFFGIASCTSLLHLREILSSYRQNAVEHLPSPYANVSCVWRLQAIERLDRDVAYLCLLRRFHILNFVVHGRGHSRPMDDGFIVQTQRSLSKRSTSSPGNPRHISDATITKSIVDEVYPHLRCGTSDYERRYRYVSRLRRLGSHLQFLTDRFGTGILGLLPPATANLAPESYPHVTDSMLIMLPTDDFARLVGLLDQNQGRILHQFSSILTPIMDSIFCGTFKEHAPNPLPIEQASVQEIFEKPKGSPGLLNLLGGNQVPGNYDRSS